MTNWVLEVLPYINELEVHECTDSKLEKLKMLADTFRKKQKQTTQCQQELALNVGSWRGAGLGYLQRLIVWIVHQLHPSDRAG